MASSEHVVLQSIVGSIPVNWTKPGKAARSGEAEGYRIYPSRNFHAIVAFGFQSATKQRKL
jgi:hypothetical protein